MVSRSVTFASPLHPTRPAPGHPAFSLQKKTMSVTQTYFLAHKARAKLAREASRADHDLRLLVGHANLLDGLMLELADAEREQESWFNSSVRGAAAAEERVEYEDAIAEEDEWDSDESSSDEDSDFEEDDVEMEDATVHRVPASRIEYEDDDEEDDEDFAELELVRTPSHSSPPELDDDEDTSDDESMPPSPPTATLRFSEKDAQEGMQGEPEPFYGADFYVPPRNPARLASAIPIC